MREFMGDQNKRCQVSWAPYENPSVTTGRIKKHRICMPSQISGPAPVDDDAEIRR
jgi:hypothetical protein